MQEEQPATSSSLPWLTIAISAAVIVLLCLVAAILLLLFNRPAAPLPTAVAPAQLPLVPSRPGQAGQLPATNTPVRETPAAPQPGGRSIGDAYITALGNTGYDVQHYTLQLALDPAQKYVVASTEIQATSQLHGLAQLSLDFIGFEVSSVTVNGQTATFSREGGKLVVNLPEWLALNANFTLRVTYSGAPLEEASDYLLFVDHLGLHYPDNETIFAIAEPDGARYWFPANDHPRDKATFRFEVAVPAGLTAVGNGRLLNSSETALPDGRLGSLFVWEHERPMAPYLAVVAVGNYERLESVSPGGVPIRHYIFPEFKEAFEAAAGITGEAIDWMSEKFGPYPFENIGFVTARIPGGSMETQTMILLSDRMIGQRTVVHELAHMWFGDWVSLNSWNEMWRNEGFATYVTVLWETRNDPEELELQMAAIESVVAGSSNSYPLNDPPPQYLFELNVYYQGAMAVHALHQEMGDEAFFNGLRLYFQRYGGGTASDAEFRAVMEEAAGRSLEPFFNQWFGRDNG